MSEEQLTELILSFSRLYEIPASKVLEFANAVHGAGYNEGLARGVAHGKTQAIGLLDTKEAGHGTTH